MTSHRDDDDVDLLPLDELAVRAEQARRHLRAIRRLLPGLVPLDAEEREQTVGIEDEREGDAIAAVLGVMTLAPQAFEDVWDPLTWQEPEDFDAEIGMDILARWRALRALEQELAALSREVSDHVLLLGGSVRGPIHGSAADVALDVAARNGVVRRALGRSYIYWLKFAQKRWMRRFTRSRGGSL
jgi:hypothetical protein